MSLVKPRKLTINKLAARMRSKARTDGEECMCVTAASEREEDQGSKGQSQVCGSRRGRSGASHALPWVSRQVSMSPVVQFLDNKAATDLSAPGDA